jgi:Fe-S-cluster-containing dehydrogenase component/CRP-like cAMP-binding protein
MENATRINFPARWSEPLDPNMNVGIVDGLLKVAPFTGMDPESFTPSTPLSGILLNDSRLHELEKGDIIVREGDYGGSAFLIVSGEALVSTKSLPPEVLGRGQKERKGWGKAIAQLWRSSNQVEERDPSKQRKSIQTGASTDLTGLRDNSTGTHVFLHDIPRVIPREHSIALGEGEIFGEISALTRSARSATVVANSKMQVLEIRWQGFREMMLRNKAMGKHIEQNYRESSLQSHLRETEIFRDLSDDIIRKLAERTIFQTFGNYQWSHNFKSTLKKDISQRILKEPLIAEQGDYVDGLILIRNGFARLSRKHGEGHQTIAYLGKGDTFGFREVAHNWSTDQQRPWMLSLRSLGFVDVLKIPVTVLEEFVLPKIAQTKFPPPLPDLNKGVGAENRRLTPRAKSMEPGLMEFLVENRFTNGTQAMMIDMDRCTRCDDCIRACASTHDNNPRFIRHGQIHDHWMIANACMHCLDPVCMIGCPTGAIGRDRESGNVTINDATCIGCTTCANNCPYHNIRMVEINDSKGQPIVDQQTSLPIVKATKCDLCLEQPSGPACQRACPHDALVRIDISSAHDVMDWTRQ